MRYLVARLYDVVAFLRLDDLAEIAVHCASAASTLDAMQANAFAISGFAPVSTLMLSQSTVIGGAAAIDTFRMKFARNKARFGTISFGTADASAYLVQG